MKADGFDFNISPVKTDGPHPQVLMQVMSTDAIQKVPQCSLIYEI